MHTYFKLEEFKSHVVVVILEVDQQLCDQCLEADSALAVGYCEDCSKYLCSECFDTHWKLGPETHKFFDIHKNTSQTDSAFPDLSQPVPDLYPEYHVSYDICSPNHVDKTSFCETCDILCCEECATASHTECMISSLPDNEDEDLYTCLYEELHSEIMHLNDWQELKEARDKLAFLSEQNYEMRRLTRKEIKRGRNKNSKFFDELEMKLCHEKNKIDDYNDTILENYEVPLSEIQDTLNFLNTCHSQEFLDKFIETLRKLKNIPDLKMKLEAITENLERSELQRYTVLPCVQSETMLQRHTLTCRMTTAILESEININTNQDRELWDEMLDITAVNERFCIISVSICRVLKVLDINKMCLISDMRVDAKTLCCITTVDDCEIAVSLVLPGSKPQIQFFSVSSSGFLKYTNVQFSVDMACEQLAYDNYMFYARCSNTLVTFDRSGQMYTVVNLASGSFENLTYFATGVNAYSFYIIDSGMNSITRFSQEGRVLARYAGKDLNNPVRVAVDNEGFVYVSNRGNENILQLSADLRKRQILMDEVSACHMIPCGDSRLCILDSLSPTECLSVYELNKFWK